MPEFRNSTVAQSRDTLFIPFGTADPAKALEVAKRRLAEGSDNLGSIISIDKTRRQPLRLHHGPYDFRATPGLGSASDTDTRLTLIQDHLRGLCDLWSKAQHAFIDAYFDFTSRSLDAEKDALEKGLAPYGGLYGYRDWGFSALRPLPRAHIPLGEETHVRMDCAFWTGQGIIAVNITGLQTDTKSRRAELDALREEGVTIVTAEGAALAKDGATYLADLLPEPFQHFWETEVLPQSPFKPAAVGEVVEDGVRF